ncbi:hypothetical protein Tco_0710023 [Tanacetum coccineum]
MGSYPRCICYFTRSCIECCSESKLIEAPASPVVSDSDSVEPSLNSEPFSGHDTSVGSAASDPDNEPLGSLGPTRPFGGLKFAKDYPIDKHGSIDAELMSM